MAALSSLDNMTAITGPGTTTEFADSRLDTAINTGASTNLTISSDRLNTVKNFSTVNTVSNTTLNNNAFNALNTTKESSSIFNLTSTDSQTYSSNMIVQSYSDLDRRDTLYSTLSQLKNLQITQQTGIFDFTEINRPLTMVGLEKFYQDIDGNKYNDSDIFKTYDGINFAIKISKYDNFGNLSDIDRSENMLLNKNYTIFKLNKVLEQTTYFVYAFNDQINNEISYHKYFGEIETVEDNVFGTQIPYYDNLVKTDKIDLDDVEILAYETACKNDKNEVIVLHTIDVPYLEYDTDNVYGLDKLNENDVNIVGTLLNISSQIIDKKFPSKVLLKSFGTVINDLITTYSLYSTTQLSGSKSGVSDNGLIKKTGYTYVNSHSLFVPVKLWTSYNSTAYFYEPYNISIPDDNKNYISVIISKDNNNTNIIKIVFDSSKNEKSFDPIYYDIKNEYFFIYDNSQINNQQSSNKQLLPLSINGINYYCITENNNYSIYFNISSIVQDNNYNFIELSNISFGNINIENNIVNILTITPSEYFHSKITLNYDNNNYYGRNILFNDENIVINNVEEKLIDKMTYIDYLTSMSSTYGFEYVDGLNNITGYIFDPNISSIKYKRDVLYSRSGINISYEYYSPKDQSYVKYDNQILLYRNDIYGSDIFDRNDIDLSNSTVELVDVFLRTKTPNNQNVTKIISYGGMKYTYSYTDIISGNTYSHAIGFNQLLTTNSNDIVATYSTIPFILANDYDYEFSHYEYNEPIVSYIASYSSNGQKTTIELSDENNYTYVVSTNSYYVDDSTIIISDNNNYKEIKLSGDFRIKVDKESLDNQQEIKNGYSYIDLIFTKNLNNELSQFINLITDGDNNNTTPTDKLFNEIFNSNNSSNSQQTESINEFFNKLKDCGKFDYWFGNNTPTTINIPSDTNSTVLFFFEQSLQSTDVKYKYTSSSNNNYKVNNLLYNFIILNNPLYIRTYKNVQITYKLTPKTNISTKNIININETYKQQLDEANNWINNNYNNSLSIYSSKSNIFDLTTTETALTELCVIEGYNGVNFIGNYENQTTYISISINSKLRHINLTYNSNETQLNFSEIINVDGYWERKYNQKIKPLINISYTYSSNSIDISNAYIVPTTKNERMGFIHNYKVSYNYLDYEFNEEYVYTYFDDLNIQRKWVNDSNTNIISLGNNEYMGVKIIEMKQQVLSYESTSLTSFADISCRYLTYSTTRFGEKFSLKILQYPYYSIYYVWDKIKDIDNSLSYYYDFIYESTKTSYDYANNIKQFIYNRLYNITKKYNSEYTKNQDNDNDAYYTMCTNYETQDIYVCNFLKTDKIACSYIDDTNENGLDNFIKKLVGTNNENNNALLNDIFYETLSSRIQNKQYFSYNWKIGFLYFNFGISYYGNSKFSYNFSFNLYNYSSYNSIKNILDQDNPIIINHKFFTNENNSDVSSKNYLNYHGFIKLNSVDKIQSNLYKNLYRKLNVKSEQVLKEYIVQEEELVPQIAQIDTPFGLVNGKKVVVTDQVYVPETYVTVTTIDPETKEYVTERVLANDAYMAYTYEVEDIPFITSTYVFNGDEGIKIQGLDLLIEHFTGQKINNSSDNSSLPSSNSTTSLSNGYNGAVISKAFQKSFDSYLSYISNSFVYLNEALDRNTKNISQAISDNNNREYVEQLKVLTNALYSTANSQSSVDVLNTSNTINAQKNMISKISDSINNQTSTLSRMMLISMLGNSTSGYTYGAQTLFNNVLSSMTAAMPKNWQSVTKIGYQTTEIVEVNTYKSTSSKHTKVIGKEQRASNFKEVTTNHIYQYPSYVSFSYMNAFEDNSSTTERIGLHLTKESRDFTYNGYVYHEDYFTYKNVADILADLHVSQALPTRAEFIVDLSKRLYINSDFIFSYTSPSEYAKRAIYRADVLWTELVNANIVKSEESSYRPLPSIPAERNYWYYDNVKFSYFAYAFNLDMIKLQQADESVFRAIDSIIGSRIDNNVNEDDVTTISNILLNSSKMNVLSNIWGTNKDSLTEEVLTKLNKIIKPYLASYNSYEMHITDKVVMTKPDMIIKREKDLPDKKEVIKRNTKV